MKNQNYDFSNTQIQIPEEVSDIIAKAGSKLVKRSDLYSAEKGYEDNPHITILYGVHSASPPLDLIDALETYPKFVVRLSDITLFRGSETGKKFDVVKIDAESPDLFVFNEIVKETCKYTTEFPDYHPHVTIAYTNPGLYGYLEGNPAFRGLTFVVDRILFSGYDGLKREIFLARR